MERFELMIFEDADELARAAGRAWLDEIEAAPRGDQPFSVALSGGKITPPFLASAVEQARERKTSFEHVHFFWADERCVPPDDRESNYRMAYEGLFAPMKIAPDRIHRVRGEKARDDAASLAETEIRRVVSARAAGQPILDLIFLGLGEDGHVASLFPGESAEMVRDPSVYRPIANSPKPPPDRVTLGYPAIAAAREVWMLAAGSGKEAALRSSLSLDGKTPFGRVLGLRAHTRVFTDIPVTGR